MTGPFPSSARVAAARIAAARIAAARIAAARIVAAGIATGLCVALGCYSPSWDEAARAGADRETGIPPTGGGTSGDAPNDTPSGGPTTGEDEAPTATRCPGCSLAYLAGSNAGLTRLHLLELSTQRDVSLPLGDGEARAVDFAFSPDGAWVAYRGGPGERRDLYITRLSWPLGANELRLDFDCSALDASAACNVLDYAWSPDGRRLAVVLSGSSAEQDYLSGVDLDPGPSVPWPLSSEATWGQSLIALDYHAQLTWSASGALAFLGNHFNSPAPSSTDALYSVELLSSAAGGPLVALRGFSAVTPPAGSHLLAGATGWAVIYRDKFASPTVIFHDRTSTGDLRIEPRVGMPSPSGLWTANVDADARLGIIDLASGERVSESDAAACDQLIAWSDPRAADGAERLACSRDGRLRLFDHLRTSPRLEPPLGIEVALETDWSGARRAFSPSGRALIVGSREGEFTLVDVSESTPSISDPPLYFAPPSELALPAGREVVALGNAESLIEYSLPGSDEHGAGHMRGPDAPLDACEELYSDAPHRWCGAPNVPGHFVYGKDASLLFESAPGVLSLALAGSTTVLELTSSLPACGDCLHRPYAFAP